jgi:hypothetical protein
MQITVNRQRESEQARNGGKERISEWIGARKGERGKYGIKARKKI